MNEASPTDPNAPLRRFTTVQLLIAIAAFFVSMPFIGSLDAGPIIESTLITIMVVCGVVAIADRRRTVIVAVILAVPAVIGRWLHDYQPDLVPPELFLVAAILLILFVIANLLRFVLTASSVNTQVLCASISAYLLLGFLSTLAYCLIAQSF